MKLPLRAFLRCAFLALAGLSLAVARADTTGPITDWFVPNDTWTAVEAVTPVEGGAKLELTRGGTPHVMVLTDAQAKAPQLRSKAYLTDIVVQAEYLFTTGAKAGIYLNSTYRIQLDGDAAGTIGPTVSREDAKLPETFIAPAQAAPGTPGTWHRIEARLRAARYDEASAKSENALVIEMKIDGVPVHTNVMPLNWSRG